MTKRRTEEPRLTRQSLKVLRLFVDNPRASLSGADMMRDTGLSSGTIYPILLRFEDIGLLRSRWEKGQATNLGRPRRRLYSITADGQNVAREALAELGVPLKARPVYEGA